MMEGDKPFKCPKCGQCFANSDHLAVHQLVHFKQQKSLQVKIPGMSGGLVADQTPTPTRFLRTAEVDGSQLFEEINPFDQDFKLHASSRQISMNSAEQNPSIGSTSDESPQMSLKESRTEETPSSTTDGIEQTTSQERTLQNSQSVSVISSNQASSTSALSTKDNSNAVIQAVLRQLQQAKSSTINTTIIPSATISSATATSSSKQNSTTLPDNLHEQLQQNSTSSQNNLREQLKALIKSGQIKIQFSPDPSSPKVQATIVGNVPVKVPTVQQQSILKQPLEPQQQLPPLLPKEQTQLQPQQNIQQQLLIQKALSFSSQQESILSPMSVLSVPPATVITATNMVHSSHPDSNLALAKQKLKAVLQQNSNTDNNVVFVNNSRVSMVSTQSSQGKYKDIKLEDELSNSSGEFETIGLKRKRDDLTPVDKRNRFLERNRAAASRCRQKRKIWVNQLERKSDDLITTNTHLMNEISGLRSEVAQLKALLLAHKECPVTLQQKALGLALGQVTGGGAYVAVQDGQIIAIHQVGSNGVQASTAEEVASSALTDMASRATIELNNRISGTVTVQSSDGTVSTISSNLLQR